MDLMYSLWWAAVELVRAQDALREMVAVGRATPADSDRLHDASQRWDQVKTAAGR